MGHMPSEGTSFDSVLGWHSYRSRGKFELVPCVQKELTREKVGLHRLGVGDMCRTHASHKEECVKSYQPFLLIDHLSTTDHVSRSVAL